jgi:hypothetical protein
MNKYSHAGNQGSDANALAFSFARLLAGKHFIKLVEVQDVRGEVPNLFVDVLPLVATVDADGNQVGSVTIYNLPVWRLQRGNSAIVMDPVPGDIGIVVVSDQDVSVARERRGVSVPGSRRTHSLSDGFYLGGVLNLAPTQFIEFADNVLRVVTPNPLTVECQSAEVNATDSATLNTKKATINATEEIDANTPKLKVSGDIEAGGNITDNTDSGNTKTLKDLRESYDQHRHLVKNVQGGGSSINSETPDQEV